MSVVHLLFEAEQELEVAVLHYESQQGGPWRGFIGGSGEDFRQYPGTSACCAIRSG